MFSFGTFEIITDSTYLFLLKEERLYFTIVYNLPLKEFNSIFPSADIISTVQFNHDGEFLATGDKGGRVVIFQKDLGVCTFI